MFAQFKFDKFFFSFVSKTDEELITKTWLTFITFHGNQGNFSKDQFWDSNFPAKYFKIVVLEKLCIFTKQDFFLPYWSFVFDSHANYVYRYDVMSYICKYGCR